MAIQFQNAEAPEWMARCILKLILRTAITFPAAPVPLTCVTLNTRQCDLITVSDAQMPALWHYPVNRVSLRNSEIHLVAAGRQPLEGRSVTVAELQAGGGRWSRWAPSAECVFSGSCDQVLGTGTLLH